MPRRDLWLFSALRRLELGDVHGLLAAGAIDHFELDLLSLAERLEARALNGGVVNEHVVTFWSRNEAEALLVVEPFDRTGVPHRFHLLSF